MSKLTLTLFALSALFFACESRCETASAIPPPASSSASGENGLVTLAGRKALVIDSYHKEYEWSQGLAKGVLMAFSSHPEVEIRYFHMDTKRKSDSESVFKAVSAVVDLLASYKPDVVISCDDNAAKYVVEPYLKNSKTPVVFCGINFDETAYGFPCENITGIVEMDMGDRLYNMMRRHAKGDRIGFLGPDNESAQNTAIYYNKEFFNGKMKVYLARTFEEFKSSFLEAQTEVDMLYLNNNAGIQGWDDAKADELLIKNTVIPTGSTNAWIMRLVVFTIAKDSSEMGEMAGLMAVDILKGVPPSEIPVEKNKRADVFINMELANRLGLVLPLPLLKTAKKIRNNGN